MGQRVKKGRLPRNHKSRSLGKEMRDASDYQQVNNIVIREVRKQIDLEGKAGGSDKVLAFVQQHKGAIYVAYQNMGFNQNQQNETYSSLVRYLKSEARMEREISRETVHMRYSHGDRRSRQLR